MTIVSFLWSLAAIAKRCWGRIFFPSTPAGSGKRKEGGERTFFLSLDNASPAHVIGVYVVVVEDLYVRRIGQSNNEFVRRPGRHTFPPFPPSFCRFYNLGHRKNGRTERHFPQKTTLRARPPEFISYVCTHLCAAARGPTPATAATSLQQLPVAAASGRRATTGGQAFLRG